MTETVFVFDGDTITNMGQTMAAALNAVDSGNAAEFKEAYIANIQANGNSRFEAEAIVHSNLGYMSGYYDTETNKKILEAFQAVHPVFGSVIPTPEEAFEMGKKAGAAELNVAYDDAKSAIQERTK